MIVVCQKCNAEYNIRDDKIPVSGATARCKKCRNMISVKRSDSESIQDSPSKRANKNLAASEGSLTPPPRPNGAGNINAVGKKTITGKDKSLPATKPQPAPYGFKNPTKLTNVLKVLLICSIILSGTAVLSSWLEYQLLVSVQNGMEISETDAGSNDFRQGMIAILQLGLLLVTGIIFLKWIHRANSNVRKLGAKGLRFTPGWAVGYYFIPIVNLWKPYQAMKEIWQASNRPTDWRNQPDSTILGCWWTFWIISAMIGRVSFKLSMRAEKIDELVNATMVTMLSDLIDIPLGIIAIILTGKILEMQMAKIWTPTKIPNLK